MLTKYIGGNPRAGTTKEGGSEPRHEHGNRVFPKRKAPSIRSIRAVSWQGSICTRAKIEHHQLNSQPFEAVISGINCS